MAVPKLLMLLVPMKVLYKVAPVEAAVVEAVEAVVIVMEEVIVTEVVAVGTTVVAVEDVEAVVTEEAVVMVEAVVTEEAAVVETLVSSAVRVVIWLGNVLRMVEAAEDMEVVAVEDTVVVVVVEVVAVAAAAATTVVKMDISPENALHRTTVDLLLWMVED